MADECAGKDTDERKATCEPAVPLGGDTLGHVEYVRAAELRIRAGVRKTFQAFVNNKLWEDYRLTASADNLYVMSLEESSDHHGVLWATRCHVLQPGQAHTHDCSLSSS